MPSSTPSHHTPDRFASDVFTSMANDRGVVPDWAETADNLMKMAKKKRKAFEYSSAIQLLCIIEKIWETRKNSESSPGARLELHQELGKAYAAQGKLDEAIEEHQKILNLCQSGSHLEVKSESYLQIGQLLCKRGDYERALGYVQRAIATYRRLGDQLSLCKALRNLGVIYVELGDLDEADFTYQEAIESAKNIGDRLLYGDLVNNMGAIMNMRGNRERALELYTASLLIYEKMNEIRKCAYTKNNIGITLAELERNDEAMLYFNEALVVAREIDDSSLQLILDINLAGVFVKLEQLDSAQDHLEHAEQHLTEAHLVNGHLVEAKKLAGMIAAKRGNFESAMSLFDEACQLGREIGTQFLEAEVLLERGTLLKSMDRHFAALADLEACYKIYSGVNADGKRDLTERVINSIETLYLEIFDSMARDVERKDQYTRGHSGRVATLSLLLAKECGLKPHMLKTVVAAGLLHDVGKLSVEDAILKKEGGLTDKELQLIRRHPEMGVQLLDGKEFPWDIKPLILHHHEKLDGTGYPMGLKGEDVPLGARILSIADVFDALTTDRAYRARYDVERALQIMNEDAGTSFDPILLRRFGQLIRDGKADSILDASTDKDDVRSIWSKCMVENDVFAADSSYDAPV